MCGIVGIADVRHTRPIDRQLLTAMNDSQTHRGPDGFGLHIEPGIGLGHRRLSIIDIAGGQQPLFNEDGSVVVTYNGEIYNFQSLMAELKTLGHEFRTHCDTEVIVHAWEQWGEECVHRFRGMFAFAVWDSNRRTLFLARDRLGIKPLYYAWTSDDFLIFGSELKALKQHPGLQRDIDPCAVEDYFAFGYVPDPRTIFTGCYKLPPGHTLTVTEANPRPAARQYWDLPFQMSPAQSCDAIGRELVDRLADAVKVRMVAEVPLGAFLSGGVDSSSVVALMARAQPSPVKTCSISFGDPNFNESPYAAKIAQAFGTDHSVEQVDPDDYSLVPALAGIYDEPYADSSAIPTYRVCQLARRSVTVALSGDGGDENLAGYRRYKWFSFEEKIRGMLPRAVRAPLFGAAGRIYPKADWAPRMFRAKSTLQAIARDREEGYLHSVSIMHHQQRAELFTEAFTRDLQGYNAVEVFRDHMTRCPTDDPLSQVQYLDFKTYLPGDILTKVDRASMAHALEVRVPLLDHELVEWISGLPSNIKLHGSEGKYVFKRSLESLLPHDVLYRAKMGFGVPISRWFREDLRSEVRDTVLGERLADTGIFNAGTLARLVDQHQSGRNDHGSALWSLLMFDAFLQNSAA